MLRRNIPVWHSRIALLLAVWLAMLAGSTSLVHAHPETTTPHQLGWLTLADESGHKASEDRHRHRIIFGVEFPAESCPEGLGDDPDAVAATPVCNGHDLSSPLLTVVFADDHGQCVLGTTRSLLHLENHDTSCSNKGRHRITGVARL